MEHDYRCLRADRLQFDSRDLLEHRRFLDHGLDFLPTTKGYSDNTRLRARGEHFFSAARPMNIVLVGPKTWLPNPTLPT